LEDRNEKANTDQTTETQATKKQRHTHIKGRRGHMRKWRRKAQNTEGVSVFFS